MKEENLLSRAEIVEKLIGNITPEGAAHIDKERFENLKEMCSLAAVLVYEIFKVADQNKNRHEYSMKIMGEYADNFLKNELGIVE